MNELKWMNCQKWSETLYFLPFLCETELSLKSRAHFADLIFQKGSETDSFLTCSSGNRALPTLSCAFCRPNLPKVLRHRQFFYHFQVEIELSLQPCKFCRPNLPKLLRHRQFLQFCALFVGNFPRSSRETAETETLLPRPRKPLYPKKHLVCARGCFQA